MSLYNLSATRLDGTTEHLSKYRGSVLLIVNTASRCGFTPQYQDLQQIYERYHSKGLEILGFPCNQFGRQEPGGQEEIQRFCDTTYRVTFPMFEKISVNGPDTHPLYAYLKAEAGGLFGTGTIKWNFTKFLVSRTGQVVVRYAPYVRPSSFISEIERLLNEPSPNRV